MRRYVLLVLGSFLSIFLDQWSKLWAVDALTVGDISADQTGFHSKVISVIDGCFNFKLAGNKGAAWGMFRNIPDEWRVPFFVLISVIAIGVIVFLFHKSKGQKLVSVSLCMVLGGAIGNLIDRIRIGYVIDFIDWYYGSKHWPTFNVADIAITVGVIFLLVDMIFRRKPANQEELASK